MREYLFHGVLVTRSENAEVSVIAENKAEAIEIVKSGGYDEVLDDGDSGEITFEWDGKE